MKNVSSTLKKKKISFSFTLSLSLSIVFQLIDVNENSGQDGLRLREIGGRGIRGYHIILSVTRQSTSVSGSSFASSFFNPSSNNLWVRQKGWQPIIHSSIRPSILHLRLSFFFLQNKFHFVHVCTSRLYAFTRVTV